LSFRLKTIIGIAIIEVFLLSLLIVSNLYYISNSNEEQLILNANTKATLFANATKDAILSTDLATLDSATDEIIKQPEISYVKIISNGITLAEAGSEIMLQEVRDTDSNLHDVDDGIFDLSFDIIESDIKYAEIKMGISTLQIESTFDDIQNWSITIAIIEVFLVGIFSYILGSYLTSNLKRLEQASQIISTKGPGHQMTVKGSDEIAKLVMSFNDMSKNLRESYDQLEYSLQLQNELLLDSTTSRAKIEAILEASLDALIIINQNGLIEEFNSRAEEIFGWSKSEVINKPLAAFIIPQHLREAHTKGMEHYLLTGEGPVLGQRLELTALHQQGYEFPIEITISNIKIDNQEFFASFIRNITERKKTETELRLSSKAFETVEGIFIADQSGQILRVNKSFTRVTGYSEAEILGKNPRDFLKSGVHDTAFYDDMWKQIRLNGKWSGEIYNKRKNGEIFPEYLSIAAVYDEHGKRSHFVAHFVDITEQKNNETKLKKARQEAEKANEAKSRFLATMSHEIRTPLGAVLGILDMLKQTELSQKQSNLVKTGEQSGKQLLDIINTILDFSRMKAGKLEIEKKPLRLHELFIGVKEILETHAINKGLDLRLTIHPDVPQYALGDATRIRQILINLINNAIKFTEHGHVEISAQYQKINEDDFVLTTKVSDTGIGISEEFQKKLFDEFTMHDESHARKQEGSGLGLAICHQLVQLMDGHICAKNNDNQGSVFEFEIRLKHATEEQIIIYEHQYKPKTIITNTDIKVLVAEDNPANRMIFANYLSSANIEHKFVNNGIEAIEIFQKEDFDIILMDISMPLMDGIEATHQIRRLEQKTTSPVPIIALTAHTMDEEIKHYLAEGMNGHLAKPCNKESMLSCIQKWTGNTLETNNTELEKQPPEGNPANVESQQPELIDQAVIDQLIHDTSEEIVPELLQFYIAESEKLLEKILLARDDNDANSLEFNCHTLGSSSGAHAAMPLHYLARKIEHYCRDGSPDQAFALIDELESLAKQSFKALDELAKNMSNAGTNN
jgi:PAS domain S-box-containing protein